MMSKNGALILLFCCFAFWTGWYSHRYASRPPIRRGVQTWYEFGYGANASIYHNVYPPDGKPWFAVHGLNGADTCPMCLGEMTKNRDEYEKIEHEKFLARTTPGKP